MNIALYTARTNFEAHIYPFEGVFLKDIVAKMEHQPLTLHEASKDLPLKVFQCHPPMSKKIITLCFEPVNEDSLNIVITGNTWLYPEKAHTCNSTFLYSSDTPSRKS